jgi:hypothetical protein
MTQLTSFQNKIENRIFRNFGSNITITNLTTTTDKWGDSSTLSSTVVSTQGVPFNFISDTSSYEPFGDLSAGEMDMMLRYSETLACEDYRITYDSIPYLVKKIEKYPFANGNLALAVRLVREL